MSIGSPVDIDIVPVYLRKVEDSKHFKKEERFVWIYRVSITNNTDKTLKIISQKLETIDDRGYREPIESDGLNGANLKVHESVEYSGIVSLGSASGVMIGEYSVQYSENNPVTVEIPMISLDSLDFTQNVN